MAARILVLDDTELIRVAVEFALAAAGHVVLTRGDGQLLESDLRTFRPDVVVLDVMLPYRDGFTLLGKVRAESRAGVVMLTARDEVDDRLRGFDGGADDYVVKPFILSELVARINALLRRMGRIHSAVVIDDLIVDAEAGLARRGEAILALTATEFRLLCYFAENRGKIVTKSRILAAVWGFDSYDPNLVEVFISALRRKMEEHGPRLLHTARGIGYVLRAGEP